MANEVEICLGCGKPTADRDCGCPAGTGFVQRPTDNVHPQPLSDQALIAFCEDTAKAYAHDPTLGPTFQAIADRLTAIQRVGQLPAKFRARADAAMATTSKLALEFCAVSVEEASRAQ